MVSPFAVVNFTGQPEFCKMADGNIPFLIIRGMAAPVSTRSLHILLPFSHANKTLIHNDVRGLIPGQKLSRVTLRFNFCQYWCLGKLRDNFWICISVGTLIICGSEKPIGSQISIDLIGYIVKVLNLLHSWHSYFCVSVFRLISVLTLFQLKIDFLSRR